MHHIGSWCPGRHSILPLLFRSQSQGVTAAVSLFVNRETAMLSTEVAILNDSCDVGSNPE